MEPEPTGVAFTVTSTVNVFPTQPFGAVGVTVYLTTPEALFVVLVSICEIVVPQAALQLLNPVMVAPDCCAAVQVNVVPGTVEFKLTLVVIPLQIDCGDAEPTGPFDTTTAAVSVQLPTVHIYK